MTTLQYEVVSTSKGHYSLSIQTYSRTGGRVPISIRVEFSMLRKVPYGRKATVQVIQAFTE